MLNQLPPGANGHGAGSGASSSAPNSASGLPSHQQQLGLGSSSSTSSQMMGASTGGSSLQSQYSPPISQGLINNTNTSPTFNYDSLGSSVSTVSSLSSSYSFHNPRLRYYLSKSFDIEDDLEFCPEIPEWNSGASPNVKKFNPYTASVFSPGTTGAHMNNEQISPITNQPQSPRVNTPRIRKPIEIINPQTKMRVGSPAIPK